MNVAGAMADDPIVSFYSGGVDDRDRTVEQILSWPDERLENVHDYIQWVFPTTAPSGVNPYAPLVNRHTMKAFAERAELRDALRRSLDRMLAFYGLRRSTGAEGVRIEIDAARFAARSRVWLHPGNHNHLRLTRIMDSLAALGLEPEARALQNCLLKDVYEGPGRGLITRETADFWREAGNS